MKPAAIPVAALLVAATQLPAPAARADPGDRGGLYSQLTLTSDYRYQGVSSSDRHAAVQGVVHYFRPDGWYAGSSPLRSTTTTPARAMSWTSTAARH